VVREPADERRDGPAHRSGVHDEHDRRIDELGHVGRAALHVRADAVEKAHDALDDEELRPLARHRGGLARALVAAEPRVEVARGPTGREAVVARIDEVGSDLGCPDAHARFCQGSHEAGCHRGLAHP
jgi:hypothetical protein